MDSVPVVTSDKMEKMNRLKEQQKQQYERKRTTLLGGGKGVGTSSALGMGGAMTLESMNLDRKDFGHEHEYDPLNPTQSKQRDGVNIKLQA